MPNIIIETSREDLITKPDNLLARVNDTLWQSGQFGKPTDIKARIYTPNNCLIGLASGTNEVFIMVHFYLMPGRDDATIRKLSTAIATAIQEHFGEFEAVSSEDQLQICVNPTVLSQHYVKKIV